MQFPQHLHYAPTHEWAKIENDVVITGISDHAQDALGDVVYIELPEVGQEITAGEVVTFIESVKTASDIHAPISGTIIEVNTALDAEAEIINEDPYGRGWIYKIKPTDTQQLEQLWNAQQYQESL